MKRFKKAAGRTLIFLLAFAMLVPNLAAGAAGEEVRKSVPKSELVDSISEVKKLLSSETYKSYRAIYKNIPSAKKDILIEAEDYDSENTDATVVVVDNYKGKSGSSLIASDDGKVVWNIDVPEDGMYSIQLEYFTVVDLSDGD